METKVSEYSYETRMTDKFSTIDFEALEEIIKNRIGVKVKLKVDIDKDRSGDIKVNFESQNIKDFAGCMSSIYDILVVDNSGGGYNKKEDLYWFPVNFSFQYRVGGSNRIELFDAWYMFETGTWEVNSKELLWAKILKSH